jgi:hypothetical protein
LSFSNVLQRLGYDFVVEFSEGNIPRRNQP